MRKSVYGLATGLLIAAGVLTGCGKQAVQIQNTNTDNQEVNLHRFKQLESLK